MNFYGDSSQEFTIALLQHADDHTCNDGEPMYLPAVVFSSEFSSENSHPLYPQLLRVLSYEDMDELNQKLVDLYHNTISSHGSMEEKLRCGYVDDRAPCIDDDVDLGMVYEEDDEVDGNGHDDDTTSDSLNNNHKANRRKELPWGRSFYYDVATDSDSLNDVDKEVTRLKSERFLRCIFENDVETDSDSLQDHDEEEAEANRVKAPILGRIYKRIVHRKSKSAPPAICFNAGLDTLPTAGSDWMEDGDKGDANRKNEPILGRISKRIFHRKSESAPIAGWNKARLNNGPTARKLVRSTFFSARLPHHNLPVRGA